MQGDGLGRPRPRGWADDGALERRECHTLVAADPAGGRACRRRLRRPPFPTRPCPSPKQEQAFPRVQRDILQVEQYSQKLRSRAARGDASTETLEASRLLAHEGLNPRKLTQALQTFELKPTYEDVFQVETATVEEYLQQVGWVGGTAWGGEAVCGGWVSGWVAVGPGRAACRLALHINEEQARQHML